MLTARRAKDNGNRWGIKIRRGWEGKTPIFGAKDYDHLLQNVPLP